MSINLWRLGRTAFVVLAVVDAFVRHDTLSACYMLLWALVCGQFAREVES